MEIIRRYLNRLTYSDDMIVKFYIPENASIISIAKQEFEEISTACLICVLAIVEENNSLTERILRFLPDES